MSLNQSFGMGGRVGLSGKLVIYFLEPNVIQNRLKKKNPKNIKNLG